MGEKARKGLEVTRGLKFGSKGAYTSSLIDVTLTPENLGLPEPKTLKSTLSTVSVLSRECILMCAMEHLREGNITEEVVEDIMNGYMGKEEMNTVIKSLMG